MRAGLLVAGLLSAAALRAPAAVLVVYESGVEPYAEALQGLRTALASSRVQAVDLRDADFGIQLKQALAGDVEAVVAMGSPSLAAVREYRAGAPLIATMMLHLKDTSGISGYLDVELPLNTILAEMRVLLPQRRRVGIIRGPAQSQQAAEALETAARREGYVAVVVGCDSPAKLLGAVRALRGKVDFILSLPDATLYNSVTIKPLILTTLEDRLPVVGFSPAFVHAGAAAGIYPDYYDVGRQTGEMALRIIRGETPTAGEQPRRVRAAVNERVARLLGVDFQTNAPVVEVFR